MKFELLINRHSRSGARHSTNIQNEFERHGISFARITELGKKDDLHSAIKTIIRRKPDVLVVGAGDGTVSDVVDLISNTSINLAVIPLGTTNNFARSLNMPLEIRQAVASVANGKPIRIDLGSVNGDLFTNVTGVGLSAQVAANVSNQLKRRFGRIAYGISGLQQLLVHKPFHATLKSKSGGLQIHFETHQLIIANGRYHGGKLVADDTKLDNGELVVFTIGGKSRVSFILGMLRFYLGNRQRVRRSSYMIGRNFILTTSTPQPVELDGEVKFSTPITVTVRPKAIRIVQ